VPDLATILVVDDEAAVLSFLNNALTIKGYRVILAGDGKAGLEEFEKQKDAIDLIISDIAMPEMDGGEMAARVRAIRTDVKLMFITGYSPTRVIPEQFNTCKCLAKPFSAHTLYDAVRECLESG